MITADHCCGPLIAATLLAVAVPSCAAAGGDAPLPLTAAELDGYRGWLTALEQTQSWPTRRALTGRAGALHDGLIADDGGAVDEALARIAPHELLDVPTRYWYAFALAYRQRWAESLAQLRLLLTAYGPPPLVGAAGTAWVLTAIADQYLLLADRQTARELYALLAAGGPEDRRGWSAYQLANIALLSAEYRRAAGAFDRLCAEPDPAVWREHACAMAALARNLDQLKVEVEPHGAAAYERR